MEITGFFFSVEKKGTLVLPMGCKKLTYIAENPYSMRVIWNSQENRNLAQRWFIPDPITHPWQSPFTSMDNSPISIVDPTGEDGVAKVNHQNKRITVKAVYYVQNVQSPGVYPTFSTVIAKEEIARMNTKLNKVLNEKKYTLSEGPYAGYEVGFEFVFKPGDSHLTNDLMKKALTEVYQGVPIGNTFQKGTSKVYPTLGKENIGKNGTKGIIAGFTVDHRNIVVMSGRSFLTDIHEIFHTIFFDNDDASGGVGNYKEQELPTPDDINKLINNPQLKKVDLITPSGTGCVPNLNQPSQVQISVNIFNGSNASDGFTPPEVESSGTSVVGGNGETGGTGTTGGVNYSYAEF